MSQETLALLVHDRAEAMGPLKFALENLAIETRSVRTCAEAERLLEHVQTDLVFTDTSLPDGSWVDVVDMAKGADAPVNVVVVGRSEDIKFYLSALDRGAFDFVLPPFEREALDFVVRSASDNARRRRHALNITAQA
jgi:DNA-binding NtrC family response regulator